MRLILVILFLIPVAVLAATAQPPPQTPSAKQDAALLAIRQDAISTANRVIDELGEIEDLHARVALAEKIVELLHKARPDRCKKMLNSIFDDAVAQKAEKSKSGSTSTVDSIIGRVIGAAGRIDLELADRYIQTLSDLKNDDSKPENHDLHSATLYLTIATDIIRSNPSLAITVATRALVTGIPPQTLVFLASLRDHDPALANRFLITALQSWQKRGGKEVNELLLLYAYVFSPLRVPTISSHGISVFNIPAYSAVAKNYPPDPALATQFLTTVIDVLSNSDRYFPGNAEALVAGVEGDVYTLNILEPLIAIHLPNKLQLVAARRNTLSNYLQGAQREATLASMERWNNSPKDFGSKSGVNDGNLDYLVGLAEKASEPKRKDQLYFRAALAAVRLNKYEVALNLIDKISVENAPKAKEFIRFDMALSYLKTQQPLEADKLARADEKLVRRAYVFTLIADQFATGKQQSTSRTLQYLDEIDSLAAKLSDERERLSVLIGIGSVYARLDQIRASEILQRTIKTANRVTDFVGDSAIQNVLEIGGFYFDYSLYSDGATIFDLIQRLSTNSYYSTLQDIRSLKNTTLRLRATVSLCSAVLSETPGSDTAVRRNPRDGMIPGA
jgi:hypothetical protein